jgi:hypothetical protein
MVRLSWPQSSLHLPLGHVLKIRPAIQNVLNFSRLRRMIYVTSPGWTFQAGVPRRSIQPNRLSRTFLGFYLVR